MRIQYKYIIIFVWMTLIFMLSAEGAHESKARSSVIVGFVKESLNIDFAEDFLSFLVRKSAHIIAYFILGLIIYSTIKTYNLTSRRTIVLSIILAFLYAVFDEIHQLFVPGRSGEVRDVFIDTAAASIGVYAYLLFNRKYHTRKISKDRI